MKDIQDINYKIAVLGVGYVGKPLIDEFSKVKKVIAFDINKEKINYLKSTNCNENIEYTSDESMLRNANAIIVCVPTPIDSENKPDFQCIENACNIIGKNISKNTVVIFESSYMPTFTETFCIPKIEKVSGLTVNNDFFVGYSPERINPGDTKNTLKTITKLISANDSDTLNQINQLYSLIPNINLFKTSQIKVAELSKLVENCQRDLNIAFVNEISKLCHELNIDVNEVLDAASTKWNFMRFNPGLVGGDCVGVNTYYLLDLAQKMNVNLDTLSTTRKVNSGMVSYISDKLESLITKNNNNIKIAIYGYTYKENISDIRNTRVLDLYKELKTRGFDVRLCDYNVDYEIEGYQIEHDDIENVDVIILAVPHNKYCDWDDNIILNKFNKSSENKIFMDLKSTYRNKLKNNEFIYWNL